MIDLIEVHSEAHIAEVAHLAREIWQEHYVPIIGQEQVDYMVDKFQSERAIAGQLADGYEYYLVNHDEKHVGYTAVVANVSEAALLISKIYVKNSVRGHGLGKKMLEFVEDLCRHRRIKKMWLTVNKNNSRSIAWYARMGFTTTGPIVQDIGGGFVMDDFRMEKTIGG
jgi:diamine N-acetyltransferase